MPGVEVRIVKDSNGRIKEVIFDWQGYRGRVCETRAEEFLEKLRALGVDIEIQSKEYKDEYYAEVEEEVTDYEFEL